MGRRLDDLRSDARARDATTEAVGYIADLSGRRNGSGIRMAVAALRRAVSEAEVTALAMGYDARMLEATR